MHAFTAYGEAASVVLEVALKPLHELCALVAYYPDARNLESTSFPPHHNVLVHFDCFQSAVPNCRHYFYLDAEKGFAETTLDSYDKVAAGLSWSRTLATLRKGFEFEVDLEKVWEEHVARKFPCSKTSARDQD